MHSQRIEPDDLPHLQRFVTGLRHDHAAVLNEECFQTAKNEAGLDQYQVRS